MLLSGLLSRMPARNREFPDAEGGVGGVIGLLPCEWKLSDWRKSLHWTPSHGGHRLHTGLIWPGFGGRLDSTLHPTVTADANPLIT